MVGETEQSLTQKGQPYEVGMSRYREIARGQLAGRSHGLLKLLFHPESRRLLGVHLIGTGATELIHIGQTVMAAGMRHRLIHRGGIQIIQRWPSATKGGRAGRIQPRPGHGGPRGPQRRRRRAKRLIPRAPHEINSRPPSYP